MFTNKFLRPSPAVSDLVSSYMLAELNLLPAQKNEVISVYPNGVATLGFSYGNPTIHRTPDGIINQLGRGCFVTGPQERVFHMIPTDNLRQMVILFKPGVLSKILRISLAGIRNKIFEVGSLVPEGDYICDRLANAQTHQQRIEIIERWILGRIHPERCSPELTQCIIQDIHQQAGDVKIQKICSSYRINERYLERKFSELIGISPKKYADIIRFNFLIDRMRGSASKGWKDLYDEIGITDYSHLSKQVQKLADLHPRRLKEKLTDCNSVLYTENMNESFNRINILRTIDEMAVNCLG